MRADDRQGSNRRWVVVGLVAAGLILAAVLVVLAFRSGSRHSVADDRSPTTSTSAPASTSTTVDTSPPTTVRFSTETRTVMVIDPTRPTQNAGVTLLDHRELPTTVWIPTSGTHPLVVFAHGYDIGPLDYARFCEQLAAGGFVVAAPSFPLADPSRGFGLDRGDISQEALDIVLLAHQLQSGELADHITDGQVGVVGHSDGADAALLVAERTTVTDPLIGDVVAIAPDSLVGPITDDPPPLLIIHGTADSVVPYSESLQVFGAVHGTRWFLTLEGADHLPPIAGGTPWTPVLDTAVVTFLRDTIGSNAGSASGSLTSRLDALDLSTVVFAD